MGKLTGRFGELATDIKQMTFVPGETKLAPPLEEAKRMLNADKNYTEALADPEERRLRKKVCLVVTDGDPNDLPESEVAADALRASGVLIVYVQVGQMVKPQVANRLASSPSENY